MFDWFKPNKDKLLNYKSVRINGSWFKIRPVIPLQDFTPDKMPQIFTDFTRNNYVPDFSNPAALKKLNEDMMAVVKAGLVSPNEKEDGITVHDLFRDQELGYKLYLSVLEHSLLKFKGIQKCFFLAVKTLLRFTIWLRLTGRGPAISYSRANV